MLIDPATQFAPAARSSRGTLEAQIKLLSHFCGSLSRLYDAVLEIILVVNENRQIVFFNSVVPSLLGVEDPDSIYGLRPGEALGCENACRNPGGCGTSTFCSQCGAVNAILAALSNQADLRECSLFANEHGKTLDLLVRTTPIEIEGQSFVIVAISDISHEKRRRELERLFFHDVMNTARSIEILTDLLGADPDPESVADLHKNLLSGSRQLMDALSSQKILLAAENNELALNMDLPVRLSCRVRNGDLEFRVHNTGVIDRQAQLQMFQRSFSTKGAGRGLGTYGMKLLGERYLKGRICFESSPSQGTTFTARFTRSSNLSIR